ncbi:MAG: sensor histidine kinase [Janthinobacterium lividum]
MKTHSIPATAWLLVAFAGISGVLFTPVEFHLRALVAGGVAVVCLGSYLLVRRYALEHGRQTARYVAAAPDLPKEAPEASAALQPVVTATRQMAQRVAKQVATLDESRLQLEILLEGMQDAVLSVDAAGRVQWSNAHMQRLMFRDAMGASIRQGRALVHTFRDPVLLESVQTTLDAGTATECRSEALLPGRIFQVNASPLPGGGAVVVLHDNTRAEQMEREQRDFVANVSHELRTPLTSIIGYVETVLDHEALTPPAVEFLETVLKNASRMQRLTEDLLLLAQVEQAENPLFPQQVQASALLREAVRTVSGAAYAEGADLQIASCVDRTVLADENAVQQVLGNLLENAVKYSRGLSATSPRVLLAAEWSAATPGFVQFRVQDFGPGIASDHLPRIFERFYRVEKARSRAVGGTGLGLSIARQLIDQHGGRIWAESLLGQGSTFFFTLPVAD